MPFTSLQYCFRSYIGHTFQLIQRFDLEAEWFCSVCRLHRFCCISSYLLQIFDREEVLASSSQGYFLCSSNIHFILYICIMMCHPVSEDWQLVYHSLQQYSHLRRPYKFIKMVWREGELFTWLGCFDLLQLVGIAGYRR